MDVRDLSQTYAMKKKRTPRNTGTEKLTQMSKGISRSLQGRHHKQCLNVKYVCRIAPQHLHDRASRVPSPENVTDFASCQISQIFMIDVIVVEKKKGYIVDAPAKIDNGRDHITPVIVVMTPQSLETLHKFIIADDATLLSYVITFDNGNNSMPWTCSLLEKPWQNRTIL